MTKAKKERTVGWGLAIMAAIAFLCLAASASCGPVALTIDQQRTPACLDYQHHRDLYPQTRCWSTWNACVSMEIRLRESPHIYRVINSCHWR